MVFLFRRSPIKTSLLCRSSDIRRMKHAHRGCWRLFLGRVWCGPSTREFQNARRPSGLTYNDIRYKELNTEQHYQF
uniref:Secreted protein n=1 Tax=Steinernema glaseri TaxID=37863 RepID=A0A1I7ZEG5_9BILA